MVMLWCIAMHLETGLQIFVSWNQESNMGLEPLFFYRLLFYHLFCFSSGPTCDSRLSCGIQGRVTEDGSLKSESERVQKSREEMRDLVHAPLPPTWRRSSLPTEDQYSMEELRQRAACELPNNRIIQPGMNSTQWSGTASLPLTRPRRESRRSSLNTGPLNSNSTIIDVRKIPM